MAAVAAPRIESPSAKITILGALYGFARAVAQEPASGHDGACMVGHSKRHIQNLIRRGQRAIPRCNFSAARG